MHESPDLRRRTKSDHPEGAGMIATPTAERAKLSAHANMAPQPEPGKASDFGSIALLLVLYTIQGIPMGLSASVPLLLAKKVHASYLLPTSLVCSLLYTRSLLVHGYVVSDGPC